MFRAFYIESLVIYIRILIETHQRCIYVSGVMVVIIKCEILDFCGNRKLWIWRSERKSLGGCRTFWCQPPYCRSWDLSPCIVTKTARPRVLRAGKVAMNSSVFGKCARLGGLAQNLCIGYQSTSMFDQDFSSLLLWLASATYTQSNGGSHDRWPLCCEHLGDLKIVREGRSILLSVSQI